VFPTTSGFVIVDPQRAALAEPPHSVKIESLVVDGREIDLSRPIAVASDSKVFEIHYTALGASEPRRINFRYRLHGFDNTWVDVGTRRVAYYTHLPPGAFRFGVAATYSASTWDGDDTSLAFEVLPAFYETKTFYFFCVVAVVALAWSYHRFRVLARFNRELSRMKGEVDGKNAELDTKNAELEAKNTELESFSYTVSHDLKSPLVTVQGFLGLLAKDAADLNVERMTADIGFIQGAVTKMNELLDGLLALSRVGQVVNKPKAVRLTELLSEVTELLRGRLDERRVEVVIAADLPTVRGEPARLRQVFQNLIENAVKYSSGEDRGTASHARIEVTAERRGAEILCAVSDNGVGIDPRYHQRIFDLFEQLEASSDGIGIGLSMVQRIVEAHGGKIWVESEGVGQGATFFFTLPADPS
jgi:signal transduction histidine kinase